MYLKYFNLNSLPFENSPDPEFFFMGYRYREILALMIHGVVSRKGLICISGQIGSGKTTLATVLVGYLPADAIVINMAHPKADPDEMLAYLAHQLGMVEYPDTPLLLTEAIRQELIKLDNADRHCVLIIDESQYMSDALMQEIVVLTNLETPQRKLIQILMLGQKEFITKLNRPELRQLKHRIFVTRTLAAMDADQSFQYIKHRLQVADGDTALFSSDALELIFQYSGGIPRLINRLCDAALLGAFTTQKQRVEKEDVRNANIDLGMGLETRVSASHEQTRSHRQTRKRSVMHRPTGSADTPTSKIQAAPSSPVKSSESDGTLKKGGLIQKKTSAAPGLVSDRSSDKMPSIRNHKMASTSARPKRRNPSTKFLLSLFVIAILATAIILNLRGKNLKSAFMSEIKIKPPQKKRQPLFDDQIVSPASSQPVPSEQLLAKKSAIETSTLPDTLLADPIVSPASSQPVPSEQLSAKKSANETPALPEKEQVTEEQIKEIVESWRKAWEEKRLDDYIAFYHLDFVSKNKNLVAWEKYKKILNLRNKKISVKISNVKVCLSESRVYVGFRQYYRSDSFKEDNFKLLELKKHKGLWKIYREKMVKSNQLNIAVP
ncbi:AAA family ATPase [Desulfococcaceae bacterium HSG9]|nr:AAA family ATPase [Desulfococcaceae bacterium HSG9]